MGLEKRATFGERFGMWAIAAVGGGVALYFAIGGIGTTVTNRSLILSSPLDLDGNSVKYEERLPADGFWKYFPFVDKDGLAVTTISSPQGGLVAKIVDADSNGVIGDSDVVEVVENVNGIRGTVKYQKGKVVDSDGKTEFTKPSTVLQARIIEHGEQVRMQWNNWLQTHLPEIKAKLQEQYKR